MAMLSLGLIEIEKDSWQKWKSGRTGATANKCAILRIQRIEEWWQVMTKINTSEIEHSK